MKQKLLGNKSEGKLFIVSAPAGTGKTTLVERLAKEFECVVVSISYTTRQKRPAEIEGDHYHFVSPSTFQKMIANGEFLEYVQLYGDYYGTSREWVAHELAKGHHVILVIDTQGAAQLRAALTLSAVYIFIAPPSFEVLRNRLIKRSTEELETIEIRLLWAQEEMLASNLYDYTIINDDLETAYQALKSVLVAEEHKNF